jgi:hypothetical protein
MGSVPLLSSTLIVLPAQAGEVTSRDLQVIRLYPVPHVLRWRRCREATEEDKIFPRWKSSALLSRYAPLPTTLAGQFLLRFQLHYIRSQRIHCRFGDCSTYSLVNLDLPKRSVRKILERTIPPPSGGRDKLHYVCFQLVSLYHELLFTASGKVRQS